MARQDLSGIKADPKGWGSQFPRVTNHQWQALMRAGLSATQWCIVVDLLTQTLGTGRKQSGELDGWREYADAGEEFACPSRRVFRTDIARRTGRHLKTVERELRGLIAAGVVRELEPAWKGRAALLAVDLEETTWRLEHLKARSRSAHLSAGCPSRSAHPSRPSVSRSAHLSPHSVSRAAHHLRDLPETLKQRQEGKTYDRRPSRRQSDDGCPSPEEFTVPALRELAEALAASSRESTRRPR